MKINKKKNTRIFYGISIFLIILFTLKIIFYNIKPYINITPSIPYGIYFLKEYDKKTDLPKGTVVVFSTPEKATKNRVYYEAFMKEIVGNYKDDIEIKGNKIYINNIFRGNLYEKDSLGNKVRTLKEGKQFLKVDEYWVMGTNDSSYDSRYWGAIKKKDILYYGNQYIQF